MNNDYNEEITRDEDSVGENGESTVKYRRRGWSVIAIALSLLSLLFAFVPWLGVVFSLAALVTGIVSRKSLGYFDGITVASLIFAIFGLVFAITAMILVEVLKNNPDLLDWLSSIFAE